MEKMTYELVLSYNGSSFKGWHTQKDVPTVQGILNTILSELYGEKIFVWGAGRTDSGAHALQYHAHFRTRTNQIPQDNIVSILNRKLPGSIRIHHCEKRSNQFHATFSCIARTYLYCMYIGDIVPAHLYQRIFLVSQPLDVLKFQEALSCFIGTHDFKQFCYGYTHMELQNKNTERIIYSCGAKHLGAYIYFFIKGNGFLRGMIRSLLGVSLAVAYGNLSQQAMVDALAGQVLLRKYYNWKQVPAHGLYFKRAHYPVDI